MAEHPPSSGAVTSPNKSLPSFFREELLGKNVTQQDRVAVVRRIKLVASATGAWGVKWVILPCLTDCLEQHPGEDEFLFALAQEVPELCRFLAGPGEPLNSDLLLVLQLLEVLTTVEETVVREEAISGIKHVINTAPAGERSAFVNNHVLPMFEKLVQAPFFTSRVSACALFFTVYQHCPSQRFDLHSHFVLLYKDETPMVRRAAAAQLEVIFSEIDPLLETFQKFVASRTSAVTFLWDDSTQRDVYRCFILSALIELWSRLCRSPAGIARDQAISTVADYLAQGGRDRSWNVRQTVARKLEKIVDTAQAEATERGMLPLLNDLLLDPERVVREEAVASLDKYVAKLPVPYLKATLTPTVEVLVSDASQPVRAVLGSVAGQMAVALADSESPALLAVLGKLLRDEQHFVKMNVVKILGNIVEALPKSEATLEFALCVVDLIKDPQWRIRLEVVVQIPRVVKQLGTSFYTEHLESVLMSGLTDLVLSVRAAAMQSLTEIAHLLPDWDALVDTVIVNICGSKEVFNLFHPNRRPEEHASLKNFQDRPVSYINRVSLLHTLAKLASVQDVAPAAVDSAILPNVLPAFKDAVPNVRLTAAQVCADLVVYRSVTSGGRSKILRSLTQLSEDPELDVRFYVAESIHRIEQSIAASASSE